VKLRVLLADDHPFVRLGVRCSLEAAGIAVVGEASSGSELLRLLRATPCDAVVTDLAMPDAAGDTCEHVNFIRRLRERWPLLPVIVLTGETDHALLRAVRQTGVARILRKNGPLDTLVATVRDVCRAQAGASATTAEPGPASPVPRASACAGRAPQSAVRRLVPLTAFVVDPARRDTATAIDCPRSAIAAGRTPR
jgi:two-component system capsular synthesis response regulator RcsB